MDIQEIKAALPAAIQKNVNQEVIDNIQGILQDPELAESFRDNFLSFGAILKEGKFKIQSYVDAVKYVCFKMQDRTNQDAYALTFPDRMQRFVAEGKSAKDISAYVAAFHKSKLVTKIMEQALVPVWIINRDAVQKAINTQVELMTSSSSDLVRTQAANSILTHLKQPETAKVELSIKEVEDDSLKALREQTEKLVQAQLAAIQSREVSARDIAEGALIQGSAEDVTEFEEN